MRDDETMPVAGRSPAEELGRTPGPRHAARRHAAPRKSLLTKFQMPAGKAMMLAAMPTAVVVGMGLTPRLALADDNTGSAGTNPCVSRSDDAGDADSATPDASAAKSAKSTDASSADKKAGTTDRGHTGDDATRADGGSAAPQPSASPSAQSTDPSHTPAPADSSPAAQDTGDGGSGGGLLGGLGSAVGGLLGAHGSSGSSDAGTGTSGNSANSADSGDSASSAKASGAPAPAGSPSADTKAPTASPSGSSGPSGTSASKDDPLGSLLGGSGKGGSPKHASPGKAAGADKTVKGTVGGLSKAKANTTEAKTQAMKDLLTAHGITYSETAQDADAKAGAGSCDDGPCDNLIPVLKPPTEDAAAPPMATDPWHLTSSKLSLEGLCYRGLVDITTPSGTTKRVMKFTADSIGIGDLHQTVDNRDANGNIVTHTQIATKPGTTSTIDGPVTMYTEKLSGNLLGLLPITFSPDFPPPIQIPSVFFTNATVDQAGQFGGTLKMQGLHNYLTG